MDVILQSRVSSGGHYIAEQGACVVAALKCRERCVVDVIHCNE